MRRSSSQNIYGADFAIVKVITGEQIGDDRVSERVGDFLTELGRVRSVKMVESVEESDRDAANYSVCS